MSLPPLASVAAMEVRLGVEEGSLEDLDLARAEAALGDVSALVRDEAGRDWVADDETTITAPPAAVAVVLQAALRTYRNPDGYASESLGGGAYGYSYAPGATGAYLSEDERLIVRRAATGRRFHGGVYTVRTPSAYGEG
jgi:hypothetical protein